MPLPKPPPSMEQRSFIGSIIDDRYEIQSRLGEGGMGIVFKAKHIRLNKQVALKLLRKAEDEAAKKRFMQEAQSASKVNHTNIVDITDFGSLPDGYLYLVMEFLEGETLHHAMQGVIPPLRACRIAAQIARGLQAVHDHGIIHRDLKPENIFLLDREGHKDLVKIVDFGIAKSAGQPAGQRLTQEGMVVGTAEYMSPEQATGKNVDHRTDQYALGCILYEMLTGTLPFAAKNAAAMLHKHVYEAVVTPNQRSPDRKIPPSIEALAMRTLDKDPARRFATMREMEQALIAAADVLEKPPAETAPTQGVKGASWLPPRILLPIGIFVLIVSVFLAVVLTMNADRRKLLPPPATVPVPAAGKPPVAPPPEPKTQKEVEPAHKTRHTGHKK